MFTCSAETMRKTKVFLKRMSTVGHLLSLTLFLLKLTVWKPMTWWAVAPSLLVTIVIAGAYYLFKVDWSRELGEEVEARLAELSRGWWKRGLSPLSKDEDWTEMIKETEIPDAPGITIKSHGDRSSEAE